MHIPGIEKEITRLQNLPLDPKLVQLIEKLANNPILIQKLVLDSSSLAKLGLSSSPLLKQIQLPINTVRDISTIVQNNASIKLSVQNNVVILDLAVTSDKKAELLPASRILFQRAQLVEPQTLQLSRQLKLPGNLNGEAISNNKQAVNPDKLLPQGQNNLFSENNTTINKTTISKNKPVNQPALNIQNKIDTRNNKQSPSNSHLPLKEAISILLKNQPLAVTKLAPNLAKINSGLQLLLSNATEIQLVGKSTKTSQSGTPLKLDQSAMSELLNKLVDSKLVNSKTTDSKTTDSKMASSQIRLTKNLLSNIRQLENLFQTAGKLSQLINYNQSKEPDAINQRINTSGNFFESQMFHTNKQSNNSSQTNRLLPGTGEDLKLLMLQLKQPLQSLLKNLSATNARPIRIESLLTLLVSQMNSTAQTSPTTEHLTSSLTSALDVNAPLSSLIAADKAGINSALLRRILFSQPVFVAGKNSVLTKEQEVALLDIQRKQIGEMIKAASAVINRIETNQLLSLRSESAALQQYLFDLPILRDGHIDSFEMLFESKQDDSKQKSNKTWAVTIKFDLEPLGPMFAKVSLKQQRISTHFFAHDKTTALLLKENLEHLKNSLFLSGLDIDEVSGQQGIVPDELLNNDAHSVDVRV